MRTIAEDQLRFIFSFCVADSICGLPALEQMLLEKGIVENQEALDDLGFRAKSKLAMTHGYVSFSEAIQLFERPTYFKEVLSGLTGIMEVSPIYIKYQSAQEELDYYCSSFDLTYKELEVLNKELFKHYSSARNNWFAEQARLETIAYNLEGPDPEVKPSGYNTVPMVQRPYTMDRLVRRHLQKRFSIEERFEGVTRILDSSEAWQGSPVDENLIFIRRDRMPRLCTLQTPLRRFNNT